MHEDLVSGGSLSGFRKLSEGQGWLCPSVPEPFLVPGLLSHHKATVDLNSIIKVPSYFLGLVPCQTPGRELGEGQTGAAIPCELKSRARVG